MLIIIVIINVALSVVGMEVGAGSSLSTVSVGTSVGAMALRKIAMTLRRTLFCGWHGDNLPCLRKELC